MLRRVSPDAVGSLAGGFPPFRNLGTSGTALSCGRRCSSLWSGPSPSFDATCTKAGYNGAVVSVSSSVHHGAQALCSATEGSLKLEKTFDVNLLGFGGKFIHERFTASHLMDAYYNRRLS